MGIETVFVMKRILITLALICLAICAYAQRDIPAGGSLEVASVETDDSVGDDYVGLNKQIRLYKVKDNEGNPSFLLSISHVTASLNFTSGSTSTSISIPSGGVLLDFGKTYQDAMDSLDALIEIFSLSDGAQKELACQDGSKVLCEFHKGLLGKHISIEGTPISKSDLKALKTSFKISKRLHPDL